MCTSPLHNMAGEGLQSNITMATMHYPPNSGSPQQVVYQWAWLMGVAPTELEWVWLVGVAPPYSLASGQDPMSQT